MSSVIQVSQVYYPESDGKPMAESDDHRLEMVRHIEILGDFYRGQEVYVSGNLMLYYEQGNPKKCVSPDAFVVKGIPATNRRTYKTWIERKAPDVVFETTSRKTRRKDTEEKPQLYARMGVKEYFMFDLHQDYLDPPLQGYRLEGEGYVRIVADAAGCLESQELGLRLCPEQGSLQFYRLDTGERLLAPSERAERETKRAERETKRAEREAERAEHEAERADREAQARQAAETELARLRDEIAKRRGAAEQ